MFNISLITMETRMFLRLKHQVSSIPPGQKIESWGLKVSCISWGFYCCDKTPWLWPLMKEVFRWTSSYRGLESFTVEHRRSGWELTSWCASRRRRELTERVKLLKSQSLPPRSTGLILYKNSISWEPKFSSLGAILIQTIPMWTDNWVILWNRREQSLSSSESEAASFCLAL